MYGAARTINNFGIGLVELAEDVVLARVGTSSLQMKAVHAADALRVTAALLRDADLLISSDTGILDLDDEMRTLWERYSDALIPTRRSESSE